MALFRERPLDRLANPPDAVGRELEAAPPVESVDGAQQAGVAFLDQVGECDAAAFEGARHRNHQPQIRLHESAPRPLAVFDDALEPIAFGVVVRPRERVVRGPAAFNDLGERCFLFAIEQFRLARLPEKLIQRVVARHRHRLQ